MTKFQRYTPYAIIFPGRFWQGGFNKYIENIWNKILRIH